MSLDDTITYYKNASERVVRITMLLAEAGMKKTDNADIPETGSSLTNLTNFRR